MGKFINTEYNNTVDNMVDSLKEIVNNPYYKWTDKLPTTVIYYNQDKESSTLDEASGLQYDDIGDQSPTKYNKIENFYIYGIEAIQVDMENGEYGLEASEISGDGIILPNTITPYTGDYFIIGYLKENILFRIISVTHDTLDTGQNIYKITYKIESDSIEKTEKIEKQIADNYNMIVDNVGTEYKAVIRSEAYNFIKAIDSVLADLKSYYKNLFYNKRVQTFTYIHMTDHNFYDPYMVEFLKRNKILEGDEEYIYITHQTTVSRTFLMNYKRSFFRALETKDKNRIRKYKTEGIGVFIDEMFTTFANRLENYFQIDHDIPNYNFGIISCFKEELINGIENDIIYEDSDNSIYNIIIKYFNNHDISQSDIDVLEDIYYDNTKDLFYIIPSIIYCLEQYVVSILKIDNP